MKEKLKDRYIITIAFFVIVGIVIILKLVNLQIIQGAEFDNQSQTRLLNLRPIIAPRGNIVDRNGIPIAVNRMGFIVQMVNTGMHDEELNAMILKLIKIYEKNNDTYNKNLGKYLTFNPIGYGSQIKASKNPLARLKTELGLKGNAVDALKTPEDVFKYLKDKKIYGINDKYTDEEAYKIMTIRYEIRGFTSSSPVQLAKDVSDNTAAEVEERHHEFPGVTTDREPMRKYIDAQLAANVIGYIRSIDNYDDDLKSKGYRMTDLIGKAGIEFSAEKYLKGIDGERRVEVDTSGRLTEELDSKPATPGDDVTLTLDMKLQKVTAEALESQIINIRTGYKDIATNKGDANAGAAVAIDIKSGEILAMASYPTYDPSAFLEGNNAEADKKIVNWNKDAVNRPFINKAIAETFAPGSTFKPLVAIAGLEKGVITPSSSNIYDGGTYTEEGWKMLCLEFPNSGHGNLNLDRALATSCNVYFHKLGVMAGIDEINKWAKYFGLGEKSGIDIGGEVPGSRSDAETKKKVHPGDGPFGKVNTAFAAIGQYDDQFTPLQLANYVSSIANGGKRYTPHLIKKIEKYDGSIEEVTKPEYFQIPVKAENIAAVKNGMVSVGNSVEGTATQMFVGFPIKVACKTGTAQTGDDSKSNNGVFVCYAPADDPQIAIAVVIEHGVWGKLAAPVARAMLTEYFGLNDTQKVDDSVKPDEVTFTQ